MQYLSPAVSNIGWDYSRLKAEGRENPFQVPSSAYWQASWPHWLWLDTSVFWQMGFCLEASQNMAACFPQDKGYLREGEKKMKARLFL